MKTKIFKKEKNSDLMLEFEISEDCTYFYEATCLVELILNLASFANFNNLQWKNMHGLAPSMENS